MQEKKSFLLYFDAYPLLAMLPAEQRGHLLLAAYEYAMKVSREDVEVEPFLQTCPDLTADGRMACGFLCSAIRRDTEKWKNRRERYSKAAQEKAASRPINPNQVNWKPEDAEEIWKYV